jgi:hypothetical protein
MLANLASPLESGRIYSLNFKWKNGLITAQKFLVGEINQTSKALPGSKTCLPK